jgi:hypothetical protein
MCDRFSDVTADERPRRPFRGGIGHTGEPMSASRWRRTSWSRRRPCRCVPAAPACGEPASARAVRVCRRCRTQLLTTLRLPYFAHADRPCVRLAGVTAERPASSAFSSTTGQLTARPRRGRTGARAGLSRLGLLSDRAGAASRSADPTRTMRRECRLGVIAHVHRPSRDGVRCRSSAASAASRSRARR